VFENLKGACDIETFGLLAHDVTYIPHADAMSERGGCRDRVGVEFQPKIIHVAEMGSEVAYSGAHFQHARAARDMVRGDPKLCLVLPVVAGAPCDRRIEGRITAYDGIKERQSGSGVAQQQHLGYALE